MNYFPLNTFCTVQTDSNPNPFLPIGSRSAVNNFQKFSFYELLRVSVCPTSFVSLFPPSAPPIRPLPSPTSHPPRLYIFRFLRYVLINFSHVYTNSHNLYNFQRNFARAERQRRHSIIAGGGGRGVKTK